MTKKNQLTDYAVLEEKLHDEFGDMVAEIESRYVLGLKVLLQKYPPDLVQEYANTFAENLLYPDMEEIMNREVEQPDKIKKLIKEYESDTFSSEGLELTDRQVDYMSDRLTDILIDNNVDGGILSSIFDERYKVQECSFCQTYAGHEITPMNHDEMLTCRECGKLFEIK